MKWLVSVALAVGLWMPEAGAIADEAAEARFFDRQAREAYQRRRFDDALASFLLAHRIAPSPRTLYNAALSARLAREDALAFNLFERYLSTGADDSTRMEQARIASTELRDTLALIHVESDPSGAGIVVDAEEAGVHGVTPRTLALEPGAHEVTVRLADHDPLRLEVTAVRGETRTLQASLSPHVGTLVLDLEPRGLSVDVRREDRSVARVLAGRPVELPVGEYVLHGEMEGHRSVQREVRIVAGPAVRVRLVAEELPRPSGRLLVRTDSVSARLHVDGQERGTTPAVLELPVGSHRVVLTAPNHVTWSADVHVRDGESTYLPVTLVRQP